MRILEKLFLGFFAGAILFIIGGFIYGIVCIIMDVTS